MSDRLLRAALLAYPRNRRSRDGQVLLDCARDLGGGPREALGLARAGLAARLGALPVTEALPVLAAPLAAILLALCTAGLRDAVAPDASGFIGWSWSLIYGAALLAAVAAALGRRGLAVAGAAALLALAAGTSLIAWRAQQPSRFSTSIGIWSLDVLAAALPALAVLVAAAACAAPVSSRAALRLAMPPLAIAAGWLVPTPVLLVIALAAGPVLALAGAWRGGRAALAGALALAVAAPAIVWLATGAVPEATGDALPPLPVMAGGAALTCAGVLVTARRARATA